MPATPEFDTKVVPHAVTVDAVDTEVELRVKLPVNPKFPVMLSANAGAIAKQISTRTNSTFFI
jgi:hypothetical protein